MKRIVAAALAVAFLATGVGAFAEPFRSVAVATENTQVRASASATAKVVAEVATGTPLRVVAKGTTTATVGSRKAPWHKVATVDGKEGFVFGAAVALSDKPLVFDDLGDGTLWLDYLSVALRPGERVVAVEDFESVPAGTGGFWYPSDIDYEDDLALLVIWDDYLDATPSPDYLPEGFPTLLMGRTYWVPGYSVELAGDAEVADFAFIEEDYAGYEDPEALMPPGSRVILGEHVQVDRKDPKSLFWSDDMDTYVGEETVIVEHLGTDKWGEAIVHVEVDESTYMWRISNMYLVERSGSDWGYSADGDDESYGGDYAEETAGLVKVGSTVVLGRHDDGGGQFSTNWDKAMDAFVGKRAKVTEIVGSDSDGFLGVRVEGNTYFWRIRNLTLFGRGKPGSYGYKVGDRVILGMHRPIGSDELTFWADEMGEFVGLEATITELVGNEVEDTGCYLVHVDTDDGEWFWRVETLTPIE